MQTRNMTVGYDKPLIEHIDLRLRRGEIMTLIGPNGAGKSTILKTIVRQLRLLGGVVELDGQSLASLDNKTVAQKTFVEAVWAGCEKQWQYLNDANDEAIGLLEGVGVTMYDIDTDELKSAYEAKKASSGATYDETWQAAVDAAKAAQA